MEIITIDAKSLTKKFGEKTVVDAIDFEVKKGECFGVLGPNGAGKSTTMRMMYGLSSISQGELFVLGMNMKTHSKDVKARIGVVPQDDGLDVDFSVLDNLLVYASYHQISFNIALERSKHLLRMMKLDEVWQSPVEQLSGGMKRRLTIARSMINQPDVLFLDEPTTGLDPQARLFIWDLLRKFKAEEKTIILTTHYMEEAEQLCDRLAIMERGKILALGTPSELIERFVGLQVLEVGLKPEDIPYFSRKLTQDHFEFLPLDSKIMLFLKEKSRPEKILDLIPSQEVVFRPASLNDVFLRLAGYELKD
jgi:lipooligosaccharide transport system ATP-binding protein